MPGHGAGTREKMLVAAALEFASEGFHKTTVRKICRRAGVNTASVNYHFGSKKSLYREVFAYLFKQSRKSDFRERKIESRRDLENGVMDFIGELFDNVNSDEPMRASLNRIMFWEMISPSSVFPSIYRQYIEPFFHSAEYLFGKAVDGLRSAEDVKILVFSVISQCLFYSQSRVVAEKVLSKPLSNMNAKLRKKIVRSIGNSLIRRADFGGVYND